MRVTIYGQAYFNAETLKAELDAKPVLDASMLDDSHEVHVELVGHPSEELERGEVLIIHPLVSLKLSVSDLERALRVFRKER